MSRTPIKLPGRLSERSINCQEANVQDTLSIQDFNALLDSEQGNDSLLTALSKLTTIREPEEAVEALVGPEYWWYGWN